MNEKLNSIVQSQASSSRDFDSLKDVINNLRQEVNGTSLNGGIKHQLDRLLELWDLGRDSFRKEYILNVSPSRKSITGSIRLTYHTRLRLIGSLRSDVFCTGFRIPTVVYSILRGSQDPVNRL